MGYNTVALILNDTVGYGDKDPDLGKSISAAVNAWSMRDDRYRTTSITAKTGERGGAQYGEVISQDHADGYQVTVVHGNMGWRIDDSSHDKYLGHQAIKSMKDCLERNGFKVTKNRVKKNVAGSASQENGK